MEETTKRGSRRKRGEGKQPPNRPEEMTRDQANEKRRTTTAHQSRKKTRQTRGMRRGGCSAFPHFSGAGLKNVTVTDAPQTARNLWQCNSLRHALRTAVYHDLGASIPGWPPQTPVPGLDCSYAPQFSDFRFWASFPGWISFPLLVCPLPFSLVPRVSRFSPWNLVSSLVVPSLLSGGSLLLGFLGLACDPNKCFSCRANQSGSLHCWVTHE